MLIRLLPTQISSKISAENLDERSLQDIAVDICKLKAVAETTDGSCIIVDQQNALGQAYSKRLDVWFTPDEFVVMA